MQSPKGCSLFFQVLSWSSIWLVGLRFCCTAFGFCGGGRGLRAFLGGVSYTSTEKAKIVGETTSSFRVGEFSIFSDLVAQVRRFPIGVVGGRTGVVRSRRFLVRFALAA